MFLQEHFAVRKRTYNPRKLLARNGLTNWAVLDFQRYILTVNWFTSLLVILSGVVCREGPMHFRWARRNA